jgi:hypothetical protein
MTLIDQIREMIAEGDTERSLEELYKYVKENNADVIDTLVMLRNRMRGIQDEVIRGTMDSQTANLERAKINDAILKLLPQLTPEYMAKAGQWKEPARQTASPGVAPPVAPAGNRKKLYLIGGAVLLVAIVLAIVLSGGEDEYADWEEQTGFVDEGGAPSDADLLDRVIAQHAGFAVWLVDNDESNGQSFIMIDADSFQEIIMDEVVAEFSVVETTSEYVALYDESRQLKLRIFERELYFQNPEDTQWQKLYDGEWITPYE